jgi:hypothetical protein
MGKQMSARGFILVTLPEESKNPDLLWELIKQYEEIEGVDFATRVLGPYDIVLTVDTTDTFENLLKEVRAARECEAVGLKSTDQFTRHREVQDLRILNDLISGQEARQTDSRGGV